MELKLGNQGKLAQSVSLLIVPYGIETVLGLLDDMQFVCLLIVPYGIETLVIISPCGSFGTFNRTLWN